jgi:hypothetical protein
MSLVNRVSATITSSTKEETIAKLKDIRTSLSFLVNLSEKERKTLRKLGTKRADYIPQTLEGAKNFPETLPSTFDKDEFINDATLYTMLREVQVVLSSLSEGVNDTMMSLGADLMSSADEVYGYLKKAATKNSNVKELVDRIAKQFEGQGKKKVTEPPPAP